MMKYKVGIVGGAGYTGGELIRLLINHPNVDISWILSSSNAGNLISIVHQDLVGELDMTFTSTPNEDIDFVFLCTGHGRAASYVEDNQWLLSKKIIDLSSDFRLAGNHDFIYGLPELQRSAIKKANYIANPGCFATAIQMALLPLAAAKLLKNAVHVQGITGATGAGQKPTETTHFSWRNNNVSVYKAFKHQHLHEIRQSLTSLQDSFETAIHFIPVRGNFSRGIMATCYTPYNGTEDEAIALFQNYYKDHPFVHISTNEIHLKQVVNTNKAILKVEKHDGQIFIVSLIDNLLKGASGQAVQNMNLMAGLDEHTGLALKSIAF